MSVIIPVYNRRNQLDRLLGALAEQSFAREGFEVLVCDDGSTEDLAGAALVASSIGLHVVYLRQENRGPGAARNLGLAHARGDVAVFVDSDCIPDRDWLASLDEAFRNPEVSLAGGLIAYRGARHISGRLINYLMSTSLGGGGVMDPRCAIRMEYLPLTGNMAVRRALALAAGGFPGASWYGEDLEFSHRVRLRSGRPAFIEGARVLHDEYKTLPRTFLAAFRRGAARAWLRKNYRVHQAIHLVPSALVLAVVVSAIACTWRPRLWPVALSPLAVYSAALAALAVGGMASTGNLSALVAVPCYASLLHAGYGLGYLCASLGLVADRTDHGPADWERLRSECAWARRRETAC